MGASLRTLLDRVGRTASGALPCAGPAPRRPPLTAYMVTVSTTFFTPVRPAATAVFGGPIDISRLLFLGRRSMPVVCGACQTMNRRRAKTCKACAGKLPAYYATVGHEPASDAATRPAVSPTAPRSVAVAAHWRNVLWAAVAVVTLLSAFGLWYAHHTSSLRQGMATDAALRARPPAPGHAALSETEKTFGVEPVRTAVAAPVEASRPAPEADPAPAQRRPPVPRVGKTAVSHGGASVNGSSLHHVESDPLAGCRALHFLGRAVCMNNSCAQRGLAHHPQCAQVQRQRRLDEARRNPTLLN